MSKIIFFDIDGTLWDEKCYIPDSTKKAIKLLKENGHLVFICSGRTRCFIPEGELLDLGFDGLLCGCGTHIEMDKKNILYKWLDNESIGETMEFLYELDMPVVLEGKEYLYMDADSVSRDVYGDALLNSMGKKAKPIKENWGQWEASKFSVLLCGKDYQQLYDRFKDKYEFLIHGDIVIEMVPKGYSKATGIMYLCDKLGINIEDTFAFGDSANDIEMLKCVGCGIAMGNGTDDAKNVADYVTDSLHDDGIYNACKYFGLI